VYKLATSQLLYTRLVFIIRTCAPC